MASRSRVSLELKNKRVLVIGLAKSGVAASLFLHERGALVVAADAKPEGELGNAIAPLKSQGIAIRSGELQPQVENVDLIVVSPGVPADSPMLQQARARAIPVIGEVELAAQFLQGRIVAITGSNGKTTTTALTGDVLRKGGKDVLVGGNIGTPAVSLIPNSNPNSFVVLEVSSFQLETIQTFDPSVAVVLNVTPDHLDRHGSMEAYVAAKARIFENQTSSDFAVLNYDDPSCRGMATGLNRVSGPALFWFSRLHVVERGACVRGNHVIWRDRKVEDEIIPIADIPLKGGHNLENVLAAVSAAVLSGCEPESIARGVREFKAVEHRLEYVATIRGIEYFNDSKATNVDATIKALESFPANIHLILGGKDKGSDYTVLKPLLAERVKRVYTIGAAADKIESHIRGSVDVVRAGTMAEALRLATAKAEPGDVVLLAPACASFDQFQNYEHRGRVFKELVRSLAQRHSAGSKDKREPHEAAS
ncbi:MAG TPA: UDP-N-acetylmuramoyl-L-alanine--D-glutamate ligase [Terriglobales bacterium]|nr:UDP-N-acetylmuramoyl-L-alanine--D-glutamate ligase [Terriglobales bacterium]